MPPISAGDPKEEELRGERSFAKTGFYESVTYSPENIGRLVQLAEERGKQL